MNAINKDGATARRIRAICVESLDGSKAIAHELEVDGHTIAHVYPSGDDDWAGIIVQAVNEREALLAVAEAAKYTDGVK